MERTLTPEEKIRRAEEIYLKRKMRDGNRNYARVNVLESKKDFKLLKKMFIQILMCLIIYTGFYLIKNNNYIFSNDVLNKSKEILSYDINIPKLYKYIKEYLNAFIYQNIETNKIEKNEESIETNKDNEIQESINNVDEKTEEPKEDNATVEGIGGENIEDTQEPQVLTQMEQDAKDIKETVSLIIPLTGTITSRFGPRNSENPIVSKNHTGIDIARDEGTVFMAAMDGTVEIVSNVRGIGKSFKNSKR